jgi:hypothetical protein
VREFFKGWRRKAGCVTLVLSCLFMVGWARSHRFIDGFGFHPNRETVALIASFRGRTIWILMHNLNGYVPSPESFYSSRELDPSGTYEPFSTRDASWHWHCRLGGFEMGRMNGLGIVCDQTVLMVPYWSIVIPLTLLSPWLLLSKPRQTPPKQTAEPAPTVGESNA